MRRISVLLTCIFAFLTVTATAAHADTPASAGSGDVSKTTVIHPRHGATVLHFSAAGARGHGTAAAAQDPPMGGCDTSDVSGTLNETYTDGVLSTLEGSWSAKVLCTTTASGQSLAAINVTTSLWHNGSPVASGTPFNCKNCNLANGVGSWTCVGVTCAGSYWVGAIDKLTLPAGWVWNTPDPSSGCTVQTSGTVLQCAVTTEPVTVSPSN